MSQPGRLRAQTGRDNALLRRISTVKPSRRGQHVPTSANGRLHRNPRRCTHLLHTGRHCDYWQVIIAARDLHKTCVTAHMCVVQYNRMSFGLRNAPETFRRAPNIVLFDVRFQTCLVYLDDVIFSKEIASRVEPVYTIHVLDYWSREVYPSV